ncbi:hypothetical protein EV122DRAFT_281300 [Schizophyllum commune]
MPHGDRRACVQPHRPHPTLSAPIYASEEIWMDRGHRAAPVGVNPRTLEVLVPLRFGPPSHGPTDGVQASKPPVRLLGEYTGFNYGLRELGVPWLQHGLGYEAHGTRALTSEPDQAALTARAPAVNTNRRTSSPFAPDRAQCAVCARRRAPCFQGPLAGSTLGCRLSRNSAVTPLLCPIYLVGEWMDGSKEQRGFAFDVGASAGAPPNLSGVGSIETCIPSSFPQAPRAPPCETESIGFQVELNRLLDLITSTLYSNKEIFLRQPTFNAFDARGRIRDASL